MNVEGQASALRLQEAAALLLSRVRESCRTTQRAVDNLIEGLDSVTDLYLDFVKDAFVSALSNKDGYITMSDIEQTLASLKGQSIFEGIHSKSQFESYLRDASGGENVLLKQIVLESKVVLQKGIARKVPSKFGYFVPFLPQLEQLLNCKDVLDCVDNPISSEDGVYATVTDGLFYKYHKVVMEHGPQTLAITMHVDDVETCDPLKSRANKHNLRLFYWILANIHPDKRSSLKCINLLAIVKSKVAKEKGNDAFLQDFISGLIKLGTEGVELSINGEKRRFFGVLLFASCDNPAAANLGGFKETHFALRPCRMCMVKTADLMKQFNESYDLLRKLEDHKKQLKQVLSHKKIGKRNYINIQNPANAMDVDEDDVECDVAEEKYLDHKDPSINFGINGKTLLSEVPGFDVTKCLPQDFMHLLAEGTVELLCRLLLKELCFPPQQPGGPKVKPKLTLAKLNNVIQVLCDFGHDSHSKPSLIEKSHITGSKLKQSAAQMLVLMGLLPFIVYNRCSNEKLELLVKLIRLVDACMAFELKDSDIVRLETLVEDFGTAFAKNFPKVKTLKLHCMVHLRTQARLFGPIRQQWCFRFESMHSKFTALVPVVKCKKNIALSVASRHLSARNAELLHGRRSGNFLDIGEIIGKSVIVDIAVLPVKDLLLEGIPGLTLDKVIFKIPEMHIKGFKWQAGLYFLVENQDHPVFGRISEIYSVEEKFYFVYNRVETDFLSHFNVYQIKSCRQPLYVVSFSELHYKFPILRYSFSYKRSFLSYLLVQNQLEKF